MEIIFRYPIIELEEESILNLAKASRSESIMLSVLKKR